MIEDTPQALANLSPGFELARTLGYVKLIYETLKGLGGWRTLSGLQSFSQLTQSCRWRSNSGLKLANAFGVFQAETTSPKLALLDSSEGAGTVRQLQLVIAS